MVEAGALTKFDSIRNTLDLSAKAISCGTWLASQEGVVGFGSGLGQDEASLRQDQEHLLWTKSRVRPTGQWELH